MYYPSLPVLFLPASFLNAKKEAPELSSFMQAPLTETCGGLPTAVQMGFYDFFVFHFGPFSSFQVVIVLLCCLGDHKLESQQYNEVLPPSHCALQMFDVRQGPQVSLLICLTQYFLFNNAYLT